MLLVILVRECQLWRLPYFLRAWRAWYAVASMVTKVDVLHPSVNHTMGASWPTRETKSYGSRPKRFCAGQAPEVRCNRRPHHVLHSQGDFGQNIHPETYGSCHSALVVLLWRQTSTCARRRMDTESGDAFTLGHGGMSQNDPL